MPSPLLPSLPLQRLNPLHKMPLPNLESLLVKVDLSGRDASAALELPENKGRCLFENAGEGSTSRAKVNHMGLQTWNSLTFMWYSH